MWTSEAPTLPDYTNDSSIVSPWWEDLGKTQEKFSKKFFAFLSASMLVLRRLRLPDTGRWLVSFAPPFIQNKNSSLLQNNLKILFNNMKELVKFVPFGYSKSSFKIFRKVQIRLVRKSIRELLNICLESEKQVFLIFRSPKEPKFFFTCVQFFLILILHIALFWKLFSNF